MDFDPDARILRVRVGRVLNEAIFLEAYGAIQQFIVREGACRGIVDCTDVSEVELSTPFVHGIARRTQAFPEGSLRVVVAPQALLYGLSRMVESMRGGMNGDLLIARSLQEGYTALGLSVVNFSRRL